MERFFNDNEKKMIFCLISIRNWGLSINQNNIDLTNNIENKFDFSTQNVYRLFTFRRSSYYMYLYITLPIRIVTVELQCSYWIRRTIRDDEWNTLGMWFFRHFPSIFHVIQFGEKTFRQITIATVRTRLSSGAPHGSFGDVLPPAPCFSGQKSLDPLVTTHYIHIRV